MSRHGTGAGQLWWRSVEQGSRWCRHREEAVLEAASELHCWACRGRRSVEAAEAEVQWLEAEARSGEVLGTAWCGWRQQAAGVWCSAWRQLV